MNESILITLARAIARRNLERIGEGLGGMAEMVLPAETFDHLVRELRGQHVRPPWTMTEPLIFCSVVMKRLESNGPPG